MVTNAESDRFCVVLVSTRNPLNIGAAARAMSNFGFLRMRVVNPYEEGFREARSAVGASSILKLAEQYSSIADAVADCSLVLGTTAGRNRDVQHELIALPEASARIREQHSSGQIAVLFGSEKRGLSNEDFSYCHWILRIPTREEHPSMNLGQAVAVCLYELGKRATNLPKATPQETASARDLESITATLSGLLSASGYVKRGSETSTSEKLRRLVRRLHLNAADGETLLGMLNRIDWKVKSLSEK